MSDAKAPPGWYPVQGAHNTQRFWDGNAWTEHTAPLQQASAPKKPVNWFVVAVMVLMLLAIPVIVAAVQSSNENRERCQSAYEGAVGLGADVENNC